MKEDDRQLGLLFARGRETSKAAAESVQVCVSTLRARVLREITKREGRGLTCDECEVITGLMHQTCSARVYELHKIGRIHDSGQRRKTRSGRKAIVWVTEPLAEATEAG